MTRFENAAQVRKFLKAKGFTNIKVRWSNNPFGGEGKFSVEPTDIPAGVAVLYDSGSPADRRAGKGSTHYTSDGGESAKKYAALKEALKGTNTIVV